MAAEPTSSSVRCAGYGLPYAVFHGAVMTLLMVLALIWSAAPARAQGPAGAAGAAAHIRPTLIAETPAPAPGQTIDLALLMQPDAGWHGYWANPGDAGVPLAARWTLPAGARVGAFAYPVPEKLLIAGLMNYVFERDYALILPFTVPADARRGDRLRIAAELDWLACTDQVCVPERGRVNLVLTVGTGAADPAQTARFDGWRRALPRPLGAPVRAARAGNVIRLAVPLPAGIALDRPYVFPLTERLIDHARPQSFSRSGDTLIVELPAAAAGAQPLAGVLRVDDRTALAFTAVAGPVPPPGTPVVTGDDGAGAGDGLGGGALGLIAALGAAILGGLILNIMPCVFPILSLKALGLARGGIDEAVARREALAYSAGVILTCVALGGLLLALRAGGASVGWAFQLQDPRVIALLLLLVVAIAFNLAGLFELASIGAGDALAHRGGTAGAFWTGALAAFVATPCTGPFMAAALGAALVLPVMAALAIFAGLGLGLALPFLAIGFVPALRRRLPRPGAWMTTLRRILAVPMFATALGLAWILGRQAGGDGMALGLAAALLLGLGLWWLGVRQAGGRRIWPALPVLLAALALTVTVRPATGAAAPAASGAFAVRPFSDAALASARASGRPVFVYFTADWCITCKVNERAAIDRADTARAFAKAGIEVLVGDWTNGDPAIGRFLAARGRSGVPLYLFYRPGAAEPEELPQLLTPAMLTALAG